VDCGAFGTGTVAGVFAAGFFGAGGVCAAEKLAETLRVKVSATTERNSIAWRDRFTTFLPFKSSLGGGRRQLLRDRDVLIALSDSGGRAARLLCSVSAKMIKRVQANQKRI
jgi:hypothetical protein